MRGMAMQVLTGLAVCACAVGAITVPLVVLGVPSPGRIIAIPSPETPEESVIAIGPGSPPSRGRTRSTRPRAHSDRGAAARAPAARSAPASADRRRARAAGLARARTHGAGSHHP